MKKVSQSQIDTLVKESQGGDANSFAKIYDVYFAQIHRYVFYKISKEHVDDVVSTIFVKAWSNLKKYKKQSNSFGSWLFRIAHNTVIDHYRTHKEYYELEDRVADDESLNPRRYTEMFLNGKRVHKALRTLGDKYQEVILLKYMNEMSNKDISTILKISESNVRTLHSRALRKLKSVLEEEERCIQRRLKKSEDLEKTGFFRRLFAKSS